MIAMMGSLFRGSAYWGSLLSAHYTSAAWARRTRPTQPEVECLWL